MERNASLVALGASRSNDIIAVEHVRLLNTTPAEADKLGIHAFLSVDLSILGVVQYMSPHFTILVILGLLHPTDARVFWPTPIQRQEQWAIALRLRWYYRRGLQQPLAKKERLPKRSRPQTRPPPLPLRPSLRSSTTTAAAALRW